MFSFSNWCVRIPKILIHKYYRNVICHDDCKLFEITNIEIGTT